VSIWEKKDDGVAKNSKATTNAAVAKLGSGTAIPSLKDLSVVKEEFQKAGSISQSEVTSDNVRQAFYDVGSAKGFNAKLQYLIKGKVGVRAEKLKTISQVLQYNSQVIRQEAQIEQTISRYAQSSAPQLLGMQSVRAEHQGYEVYMKEEVDELIQGWK